MRTISVMILMLAITGTPLHAQGLRLTAAAVPVPEAAYAMSNPTDASGHGRTATFANMSTAPGKYAEGQAFNGTASRMTIPGVTLGSGFTLECWVRFAALTRSIVGVRAPREGGPAYWQAIIYQSLDNVFLAEAGGFLTAGFTPQGGPTVQIVSPTATAPNVLHHVAVSYDGVTLLLVVDGLQVASKPATGAVATSGTPLEVGGSASDAGFLSGVIDDVRIYGRGLTLTEIAADLATPVDTVHEPVVSWDLEVFEQDASPNSGGSPIALATFPKMNAVCNLAVLTPPVGVVQNPTTARVTDPIAAGKECELTIESFVLGLPIHAGYTSTARARGATTVSGRSPASNPFDRVAVTVPPPAPGSTIIAK